MNVRAITVRQPWAEAIVDGHKPVENRSGGFPSTFTGLLIIHAAAIWSRRAGLPDCRLMAAYPHQETWKAIHRGPPAPFTPSAVLGWVELQNVHRAEPGCCSSPWAEHAYKDAQDRLTTDVVHLVLANPHKLTEPLPWKAGRLGLWRPPPALLDELPELPA